MQIATTATLLDPTPLSSCSPLMTCRTRLSYSQSSVYNTRWMVFRNMNQFPMYARLPELWNSKGLGESWSLTILLSFFARYFPFWLATAISLTKLFWKGLRYLTLCSGRQSLSFDDSRISNCPDIRVWCTICINHVEMFISNETESFRQTSVSTTPGHWHETEITCWFFRLLISPLLTI